MNSFNALLGTSRLSLDGLISYYRFEGNGNDSRLNTNLSSDNITWITGKNGQGAYTNGYHMTAPNISAFSYQKTNSFSFSFWFISNPIIERTIGEGLIINYNSTPNRVSFGNVGAGNMDLRGNTNITDTTNWKHLVFTYDGSGTAAGFNIYYNGVKETITIYENGFGINTYYGYFRITSGSKIDELAIYNRVLSQAHVTTLYNSGTGLFY
jgi:hypothetical protein